VEQVAYRRREASPQQTFRQSEILLVRRGTM
jgi:hypothetical protein